MAGNKKQTTRSNYRLAVDVGNTHTVVGLFQNTNIKRHWRLATRKDTTIDEIAFWLRGLNTPEIAATALASVVPMQDNAWLSALGQTFGVTPRILDYRDCLKLKLRYEIPSQIGADRLVGDLRFAHDPDDTRRGGARAGRRPHRLVAQARGAVSR